MTTSVPVLSENQMRSRCDDDTDGVEENHLAHEQCEFELHGSTWTWIFFRSKYLSPMDIFQEEIL